LIVQQTEKLSEIARLTPEEAIQILKNNLKNKARNEAAKEVRRILDQTRQEATQLSAKILANAVQRVSLDHVSETTVAVVSLTSITLSTIDIKILLKQRMSIIFALL
jgi:ribonuclease Y